MADESKNEQVAEERVEVTLKKPHTHGGVEYKVGDKIIVTEFELEFLEQHDVV